MMVNWGRIRWHCGRQHSSLLQLVLIKLLRSTLLLVLFHVTEKNILCLWVVDERHVSSLNIRCWAIRTILEQLQIKLNSYVLTLQISEFDTKKQ